MRRARIRSSTKTFSRSQVRPNSWCSEPAAACTPPAATRRPHITCCCLPPYTRRPWQPPPTSSVLSRTAGTFKAQDFEASLRHSKKEKKDFVGIIEVGEERQLAAAVTPLSPCFLSAGSASPHRACACASAPGSGVLCDRRAASRLGRPRGG